MTAVELALCQRAFSGEVHHAAAVQVVAGLALVEINLLAADPVLRRAPDPRHVDIFGVRGQPVQFCAVVAKGADRGVDEIGEKDIRDLGITAQRLLDISETGRIDQALDRSEPAGKHIFINRKGVAAVFQVTADGHGGLEEGPVRFAGIGRQCHRIVIQRLGSESGQPQVGNQGVRAHPAGQQGGQGRDDQRLRVTLPDQAGEDHRVRHSRVHPEAVFLEAQGRTDRQRLVKAVGPAAVGDRRLDDLPIRIDFFNERPDDIGVDDDPGRTGIRRRRGRAAG